MAWGGGGLGIDDWIKRLGDEDPTLTSLHVFKARRFGTHEVKTMCEVLCSNQSLKELYCSGHFLEPEALAALSEMLAKNTSLLAICVGDSQLGDQGAAVLAVGLQSNTTLTSLDLEGKSLSAVGVRALQAPLGGASGLRRLNLSRNPLGEEGIATLVEVLKHNSVLENLDIGECGITPTCGASLAELLSSPDCRITRLRVAENPELTGLGVAELAQGVRDASSLEELDLTSSSAGDEGASALGLAVREAPQLHTLTLAGCGITPVGCKSFVEGFFATSSDPVTQAHSLRSLDLGGNTLDEEAVTALAVALASCQFLSGTLSLDLSGARMDAPTLEALANANGVTTLRLFSCPLGNVGARTLAQQFQQGGMRDLQYLDLCGCGIGMEGLRVLFDVLKNGDAPTLKVLEVGANLGTQDDAWEVLLVEVREARPGLDVVWRTTDPGGERPVQS
mmetsp:Transcript_17795/g.24612  ORF Transcript_17795/g.24612 Transcript_17795/m.24612 type:complete len:450 (-) Transcript_17795:191-1540(-)